MLGFSRGTVSFLAALFLVAGAQAQNTVQPISPTPAAQPAPVEQPVVRPNPDKRAERPLTPQEERDRQIRLYDPLNRKDTRLEDRLGERIPEAATLTDPRTGQLNSESETIPAQRPTSPSLRNPLGRPAPAVNQGTDSLAQDYSGPSVLSRSYTLTRPPSIHSIQWSKSLSFSTLYNDGLGQSGSNANSSVGTSITWGVSGQKAWKRDRLNVGYFGSANRYYGNTRYNGGNHAISLSYGRILTRRISVNLSQTLSSTSQGYALENQTPIVPGGVDGENPAITPIIAAYDQGTRQASTTLGLTWQKSSRLSLNFSSSVFFVDRGGTAFTGATGYQSQFSANRRLTSRLSAGSYYSSAIYLFSKDVSFTSSNTAGGSLSYVFDRRTRASLRLGLTEVETQSLTAVRLDPVIAAILGQSSGIISAYRKSRFQDVSASIGRDFGHRRGLNVAYAKGLAPGNGLIQASSRETLTAGFGMTVSGRVALTFGASRESLASVQAEIASYRARGYQLSASRPLRRDVSANFSVEYRSIEGLGTLGLTNQLRISSGVSWGRSDSKLW